LISGKIQKIRKVQLSPLDYLPQEDLREKIVDLVLSDVPVETPVQAKQLLSELRTELIKINVEAVKVVVFGGGTGLSNLIGGDSRLEGWTQNPFCGLKKYFPHCKSVVCITDDGGSTGELLKDLPLVAIGDIRHVLLSSIRLKGLQRKYNVTAHQAQQIAAVFHSLFNHRCAGSLQLDLPELESLLLNLNLLPQILKKYLEGLVEYLFIDTRFTEVLKRPHCFGNLLVTAAVYKEISPDLSNQELAAQQDVLHCALFKGLNNLSEILGAGERAVLPCTSTPAQLRVLYTNGVEIIGESKLSDAQRGFPVESVNVDYFGEVQVSDSILEDIGQADILIFAPGSLYSSIIPVFKVPGLAEAVRTNKNALKVLISNLWVQAGETDLSIADPERKFHVSDMITAYEKNIPGGTSGLFNEVLCVSLKNIPASVLQRYAVEGKIPIFLDRDVLSKLNYMPVECGVYSQQALAERGVIQHDPDTLAQAIKTLYNGRHCFDRNNRKNDITRKEASQLPWKSKSDRVFPFQRYHFISRWMSDLQFINTGDDKRIDISSVKATLREIFWKHLTIPLTHFKYVAGISCIDIKKWGRDQRWDNVFSFFDPDDKFIKIRSDQFYVREKLEVALMIAFGEALLGNYAKEKVMKDVLINDLLMGKVYHLYLQGKENRFCYFDGNQLGAFLTLSRMFPTNDEDHYIRLVNSGEGFTPPGLLMGLMYAWYLDNRLATHIEYKMSLMKINQSNLIPEQLKMSDRRKRMITFFREVVFGESY
jgi:uncharacterized cofD-like protein